MGCRHQQSYHFISFRLLSFLWSRPKTIKRHTLDRSYNCLHDAETDATNNNNHNNNNSPTSIATRLVEGWYLVLLGKRLPSTSNRLWSFSCIIIIYSPSVNGMITRWKLSPSFAGRDTHYDYERNIYIISIWASFWQSINQSINQLFQRMTLLSAENRATVGGDDGEKLDND